MNKWHIAGNVIVGLVWLVWIPYCLASIWWSRHLRPKWTHWYAECKGLLEAGFFPDKADYEKINQLIDKDMAARNPLYWYHNWNRQYPLPKSKWSVKGPLA